MNLINNAMRLGVIPERRDQMVELRKSIEDKRRGKLDFRTLERSHIYYDRNQASPNH
jgi:hypothetical protein